MQNTSLGIILFGMIKVRIKEMATKRGFSTAYKLQKAMNLQPAHSYKLFSNNIKMIGLDTLDKLCDIFDCMPSDLLVHSSNRAKTRKTVTEPVNAKEETFISGTRTDLIDTAEISRRTGLNERTIRDNYKSGKLKYTKIGTKNFVSESDYQIFIDARMN